MLRLLSTALLALALGAGIVQAEPPQAERAPKAVEAPKATEEQRAERPPLQLCFVPLGRYDKALLETARAGAEYLYGAQSKLLARRKLPKAAYYKPRGRYRAEKILDFLETVMPEQGCDLVVGITAVDISTTKGEHKDWGILGLGSLGGTTGVVSSHRMKRNADREKQKRRMVSTVNHEIGHVLSAPHGGAPGCLMNDAQGTIRTIDNEHGLLCKESRALIEKHTGRTLPAIARFDWARILEH